MRPVLVVSLIVTALAASGQTMMMMGDQMPDGMMMRYAMMKMSQACMGMDVVKGFYNDLRMAKMKCSQSMMPSDSTMDMMPTMMPMQQMMPTQMPMMMPMTMMQSMASDMMDDMKNMATNMSCIMQTMNMIGTDMKIDAAGFKNRINSYAMDNMMKKDLMAAVDTCKAISECSMSSMMSSKMSGMMNMNMPALAGPMMFMKCFSKMKNMCCMKKDLKMMMPNMDMNNPMSMMMALNMMVMNNVDFDMMEGMVKANMQMEMML